MIINTRDIFKVPELKRSVQWQKILEWVIKKYKIDIPLNELFPTRRDKKERCTYIPLVLLPMILSYPRLLAFNPIHSICCRIINQLQTLQNTYPQDMCYKDTWSQFQENFITVGDCIRVSTIDSCVSYEVHDNIIRKMSLAMQTQQTFIKKLEDRITTLESKSSGSTKTKSSMGYDESINHKKPKLNHTNK